MLDHVDGVARASRLGGPTIVSDDAIPFGSISSKTKVLTPTVGKVRAVLQTGEIFEGSLYAVGEDSLWIDTSFGRMGLAASRVRSVVRIDPAKGAPALGAAGSQNSAGLERVRIKTPGGTLYGKVIERVGDTATVITDEGARLTLPAKRTWNGWPRLPRSASAATEPAAKLVARSRRHCAPWGARGFHRSPGKRR